MRYCYEKLAIIHVKYIVYLNFNKITRLYCIHRTGLEDSCDLYFFFPPFLLLVLHNAKLSVIFENKNVKNKTIFVFLDENICCDPSLESSH